MLTSNQEKAIRSFVLADVGDDIKRLIRLANWDLYYGPVTEPDDGEPWPGFVRACREIRDAIRVSDLYLDSQSGEVTDTEPQWCDCIADDCTEQHFPSDYYKVERADVMRIVVGKELAPYVR